MEKNFFKITTLLILVLAILFVLSNKVNAVATKVAKIGDTEYETLAEAISVVPTDNTQTTITLLTNVEDGTGFIVQPGQNIIIDFNNYSYDASNPLVGSTGTKTNGCQLLKGSTVTLKNGTLISTAAKILIQNYCNLTLKDMNISAVNAQYVSSNNCGKVNIIGNTSITAKAGAYAFDMCWAPNKSYEEGTQITVDTTGIITGKIELGLWGDFSDDNGIKSTLNIKNINHVGTIVVDPLLKDQLSIEGGTFSSNISEYVVKEGYTATKVSDTQYKVGLKTTGLTIKSSLELITGDSIELGTTLTPTNTIEKVVYTTGNEKVAIVDANGIVTAVDVGETTITATVGSIVKKCTVKVKEIIVEGDKIAVSEGVVYKAIGEAIEKENTNIILPLKEEGEGITTAEISVEAIQEIQEADKPLEIQTTDATIILDTKTIETIMDNSAEKEKVTLSVEKVKETDLTDKQKNAIKDKEVAMVISAELMVGSKSISNFEGGKVKLKIPFKPEEGMLGTDYKILYIANDGTVEEVTAKYENNMFVIELEHFSKYAIVKAEEVKSKTEISEKDITPKTGNTNYAIVIIGITLTILAGTVIFENKKK